MAERYNKIIEFEELSSTNDYALELARNETLEDFTVVRTQFQTKGRGQIGNHWVSNKGENLLFSLILYPKNMQANCQFILSQTVSLALRDVVSEYCENVTIKWPNDIYVGNKKIAGILIENLLVGKMIETSIIGIGLNVNQLEFDGAPNPTSFVKECGKSFDCTTILNQFLLAFSAYYESSEQETIRQEYISQLYLLDTRSKFKDTGGLFEGTIVSVENDGKLMIEDAEGNQRGYYFKEVEYVL